MYGSGLLYFFGTPPAPPDYRMKHSLGSGVIISPDGFILTNDHVIRNCKEVRVRRFDESIGAVPIESLKGEARSNAMMKAETKAKRELPVPSNRETNGWL